MPGERDVAVEVVDAEVVDVGERIVLGLEAVPSDLLDEFLDVGGDRPSARKTSPCSALIWVRMRMPRQSAGARIGRTRLVRCRKPLSQYPSRRQAVFSSISCRARSPNSPSRALNAAARSLTTNGSSSTCRAGASLENRTVDM
jgi:hypothetical protein